MPTPNLPAKKSTKLQNVHTFRCTQRKQSNRNPCVSMHYANYAFKESSEFCIMLVLSNEHVQHQCQTHKQHTMTTPSSLTKKFAKLHSVHMCTQINKVNGNNKLQVVLICTQGK